jgi:molecular chaperone HtpG
MPRVIEEPAQPVHTFHVHLRGLVDLLSHHLYSSPRVYLRELLQNAVDAVTARRAAEPDAPARIHLAVDAAGLRITDTGIGLTEADVHEFLATIGRSSKRDSVAGLEAARADFIGQFGIGLLACFVVADEITVVSRSARDPEAPPVLWRAASDGSYTVRTLPLRERSEAGTTVTLTPRRGAAEWLAPAKVVELARHFGSLLPYDVTVDAAGRSLAVTDTPPVWARAYASPSQRLAALLEYGEATFGFRPLDVIDLDVPLAGLRGVAYVLPSAASPAETGRHRVYLKGMLLSDSADTLLPDWAFFARCVVQTDALRPTASREALYEDETLAGVREALGGRIRDWLTDLAGSQPARLYRFLSVHRLSVKSLARHDDELLRIMLPWLAFETTDGDVSLTEFARKHPVVHLATSVEEFRQVAPIAAAQGLGVVNGGYTYDAELVQRLPLVLPGTVVRPLASDVVVANLDPVSAEQELALAGFLGVARARLDGLDCDVVLRAFHPVTVPALYLDSGDARRERARAQAEAEADDLWSDILSTLRSTAPRAQLVLNYHNPVIRHVASLANEELAGTAVEAIYGQALLMTHRPLRPVDTALLNRAFGALLSWASDYPRPEQS